MKAIIVEDERLAAERLSQLIRATPYDIEILTVCDCIEETLEYLSNNEAPDLAFFDIQLADGLSFSLFEQFDIRFPVIFTTAFDQYALKAFTVNSIDYLLKPIEPSALERALNKYQQFHQSKSGSTGIDMASLQAALGMLQGPRYKERFVVRTGAHILSVPITDIQYFWSENKTTYLRLPDGRKHAIEHTLEQLESMLDPARFFRVNRKFYVRIDRIERATAYSNSRLKLQLPHLEAGQEVVVSREKVGAFKAWLEG